MTCPHALVAGMPPRSVPQCMQLTACSRPRTWCTAALKLTHINSQQLQLLLLSSPHLVHSTFGALHRTYSTSETYPSCGEETVRPCEQAGSCADSAGGDWLALNLMWAEIVFVHGRPTVSSSQWRPRSQQARSPRRGGGALAGTALAGAAVGAIHTCRRVISACWRQFNNCCHMWQRRLVPREELLQCQIHH
jgi:hypothetical protein